MTKINGYLKERMDLHLLEIATHSQGLQLEMQALYNEVKNEKSVSKIYQRVKQYNQLMGLINQALSEYDALKDLKISCETDLNNEDTSLN